MISLRQAAQSSAVLGPLTERVQRSQAMLQCVLPVLPGALASQVVSGPVDDAAWTLLVSNTAVSAKLRQLMPTMEARLRSQGYVVNTIRLKVRQR